MIISRTPLRISLGGGGTDLPSFYRNHGSGFLVAAAIDKHIYIAIHRNFEDRYLLKYSEIENVAKVSEIRHPMIRAVLERLDSPGALEVTSIADIPAGTGLGSSGSFGVGLVRALSSYSRDPRSAQEIAAIASDIEINVLNEPVGKQDQYIAACGGITAFEFRSDESVSVTPIVMREADRRDFERSLMLFYTGIRRSASDELKTLARGAGTTKAIVENLESVRTAGYIAAEALANGEVESFGRMLTRQWELKYHRQPSLVHDEMDVIIQKGLATGAFGGKLIGAGGGGFLLFSTDRPAKLRLAMEENGLQEVPIAIDYEGTTTLRAW